MQKFVGKQEQIPPIYSAIKIKGKKLYEYARNNQEIQIQNLTLNISRQKEETETLQKKLSEAENKLNKSEDKLIQKQTEIEELQKKLYYYETGKLYRIAKKIYNLKNGGKNWKKI